jgi:AraC-like DNA-binding protein
LDNTTGGEAVLTLNEPDFDRQFFNRDRAHKYLTIAWNRGTKQTVTIDEVGYALPANAVVALTVNQSFRFECAREIVAWQFNRDFYCIVDHDREVGCVGFLFYGSAGPVVVRLGKDELRKMELLLEVFKDEFASPDNIQGEMIRILIVRLIIILTRLGKVQHVDESILTNGKFDIVRQFNVLVEANYKNQHEVKFYAAELNRSPKTLANYFALLSHRSPSDLIHERVALEAKRLLYYTEMTAKEIAYELGFNDAAHFSRFFKRRTGNSPTEFRITSLDRQKKE